MGLEEFTEVLSPKRQTKKVEYKAKRKFDTSALKKQEIVENILDEEAQLNLSASLQEEYLLSVGYSSPLFDYAKGEYAKIRAVLDKEVM